MSIICSGDEYAPSTSWDKNYIKHRPSPPSPITKAIISSSLSNLDTLDFEDIEKSLAAKLNDEDINAILQCINAKNLKRLKLAGCVNINGWGL